MCVVATLIAPLGAQTQEAPRIATHLYDNSTDLTLSFARSDCPAECHVAGLVCTAEGLLRVFLADLSGEAIMQWFRFDAANPTFPTAELILDGESTTLNFRSLTFDDLNGAWWVELSPVEQLWMARFPTAERTVILAAALEIELPSTIEDRAVRAEFVDACLAR
jgi:hypothetical protein